MEYPRRLISVANTVTSLFVIRYIFLIAVIVPLRPFLLALSIQIQKKTSEISNGKQVDQMKVRNGNEYECRSLYFPPY